MKLLNTDERINKILEQKKDNYWSFKDLYSRNHVHNYVKYPAMMVPEMQGELIDIFCDLENNCNTIFDPFMGSGTVLTEAMIRGLNFVGCDINPLSILICKMKASCLSKNVIQIEFENLIENIINDKSLKLEIKLSNKDKWFTSKKQISLSKIRRNIRLIKTRRNRNFFWVALAETVRLVSNSRTSTYKLYSRTDDDIVKRESQNTIEVFRKICNKNIENLNQITEKLNNKEFINNRNGYKFDVKINHLDVTKKQIKIKCDLLITSPPYGDNHTTVPYGQFSYLPLQWIDLKDIDYPIDNDYLKTITCIDTLSLGGKSNTVLECGELLKKSGELNKIINILRKNSTQQKTNKVLSFYRDFNVALDNILSAMKSNSYLIWIIGNRNVGGEEIKTDLILQELLETKNINFVTSFSRKILNKRMASKNNFSQTINKEKILVMRKGE